MNRRTFVTGAMVTTVAGMMRVEIVTAQTADTIRVEREWEFDGVSDPNIGLDTFSVAITAHADELAAEEAFDSIFESVEQGAILNQDTHNETYGDESFFVEFQNLGGLLLVYEGTIRIGTLVYEFRWEASHFGGARDGYRLMETVFERAGEQEAYTEEELGALLPTQGEVSEYGLTELVTPED